MRIILFLLCVFVILAVGHTAAYNNRKQICEQFDNIPYRHFNMVSLMFPAAVASSDICCRIYTDCGANIVYPSVRRDESVIDNYHGVNVMLLLINSIL